jgi:hypothetical protein
MMLMKSLPTALLLIGSFTASSALARPNIAQCSRYVSFTSGWLSNTTIAYNNSPNGVNDGTAAISGISACNDWWLTHGGTALSFSNAGVKVNVWPTTRNGQSGYDYQCLKCVGFGGPIAVNSSVDALRAAEIVHEALPEGHVVNVKRQIHFDAEKVLEVYFDVDVEVGDYTARVRVDAQSGEVFLPETLSTEEIIPENVCK